MPPQRMMPLFENVTTYCRDDDLFNNRGEGTIKYEHRYQRRESNASGSQSEDTDNFIVGDRVWVGSSRSPGVIAFIGETQFGSGDWAGVVLDEPIGKNNGSVSGVRYFQCPPNKGIFCRPHRLSRYRPATTAHELLSLHGRPATPERKRTSSSTSYGSSISPPRTRTPTGHSSNYAVHNDLRVGDRVIVSSSQGSKVGILRYLGITEFGNGIWCGVELNDPLGKNDGSVSGTKYFDCAPKFGLFVPVEKVTRSPISRPKSNPCVVHPDSVTHQGTTIESPQRTISQNVRVKVYYPDWEPDYY